MYLFRYHYLFFAILFLLQGGGVCLAGEITSKRSISFGTISIHPGGDTISINANYGAAKATINRSRSVVDNKWHCGEIVFELEAGEHVNIDYPDSVSLTNASGKRITLKDIAAYSQSRPDSEGRVAIGGALSVPVDVSEGAYKSNTGLVITVNYD